MDVVLSWYEGVRNSSERGSRGNCKFIISTHDQKKKRSKQSRIFRKNYTHTMEFCQNYDCKIYMLYFLVINFRDLLFLPLILWNFERLKYGKQRFSVWLYCLILIKIIILNDQMSVFGESYYLLRKCILFVTEEMIIIKKRQYIVYFILNRKFSLCFQQKYSRNT